MWTNPMRLSADDVLGIEVPAHLRGYELVDGALVAVSLTSALHGRVLVRISRFLDGWVESNRVPGRVYADVGYVLGLERDPERLRGPDVSFVSDANLRRHGGEPDRGWFRLAPDLAVEIDSPGREPKIERLRIRDYMEAGVRLLWVLHAATGSATVHRPDAPPRFLRPDDALSGEEVLPGLRVPLRDVFGEPGSPARPIE
jgi:Uma2 family endonuclease